MSLFWYRFLFTLLLLFRPIPVSIPDSGFELFQTPRKCWIAKIEYSEPTISRTEFAVLVERKSKPFISSIRLCQAPCLGLKSEEKF